MVNLYEAVLLAVVIWTSAYLILRLALRRDPGKGEKVRLYPLFIMLRTGRFTGVLDLLSNKKPILWDVASNMGISTALGLMALAVYFLARNLSVFLVRPQEAGIQNVVIPLIPFVTISVASIPYFLLAVAAVLVVHEGMHGVIARREKLPIKSSGVFLLFLLAGGFVEPDEQEFKKSSPKTRMKVSAAGSFANIVLGFVVLSVLVAGFTFPSPGGVLVLGAEENNVYGLQSYEVLTGVGQLTLQSAGDLQADVSVQPGKVLVTGKNKDYLLNVDEAYEGPLSGLLKKLGVREIDFYFPMRFEVFDTASTYVLYKSLWWIWLISIGVGIFNMLPLFMLDGDLFLRALLETKIGSTKKVEILSKIVSTGSFVLLFSNILFSYFNFGLLQI